MQRSYQRVIYKPNQNLYRKDKTVNQESHISFKESIANKYTNITFRLNGGLQKITNFVKFQQKKQYCTIYIQGKKIASYEDTLLELRKIIWFTYRNISNIHEGLNSDTSWGCLIRVGQMVLASALKRYFKLNGKFNQFQIDNAIIFTFLDDRGQQERYSLTKIVNKAMSSNKSKKFGDWFNTSEICQTLCDLHNKDPMKGSQNLKLVHFSNSIIFLEQIYHLFGYKLCQCLKRRVVCEKCHCYKEEEEDELLKTFSSKLVISQKQQKTEKKQHHMAKFKQKNVLVMVTTRVGLSSVDKKTYSNILELLSLDFSLGIVGGIPRKGLYFVGCENENLIYLDPHYVQEQVTKINYKKHAHTFYCNQIRTIGRQSLDSSMAFVFYLQNLSQLGKLKQKIDLLNEKENGFIGIEWENIFWNEWNDESNIKSEESEEEFNHLEESFIA